MEHENRITMRIVAIGILAAAARYRVYQAGHTNYDVNIFFKLKRVRMKTKAQQDKRKQGAECGPSSDRHYKFKIQFYLDRKSLTSKPSK